MEPEAAQELFIRIVIGLEARDQAMLFGFEDDEDAI
jgi:hypothetical protein